MGVRRAVLYGTVNGVCNNTNGLGRGRGGGTAHDADWVANQPPFVRPVRVCRVTDQAF